MSSKTSLRLIVSTSLINGGRMEIVAHLSHPQDFIYLHANMALEDCLCGLAARTGEIVVSKNSHEDSRHTICYNGMTPLDHIIVPLVKSDRVLGVLYLYRAREHSRNPVGCAYAVLQGL